MKLFTSAKERSYWLWACITLLTIYGTAVIAQPISGFLRRNGLLDGFFILAFILVIVAILTQQVRLRPDWKEVGLWVGIIAVYLFVFVRIEIPEERSHLFEYSVLAVFVYRALAERKFKTLLIPAVITVIVVAFLGFLDEGIQYFLPNRVFDFEDVAFNALVGLLTVLASLALSWVRTLKGFSIKRKKERKSGHEGGYKEEDQQE